MRILARISKIALETQRLSIAPPSIRAFCMWPPGFIEPIKHKSELKELRETGEFERRRHSNIRAAPNEANCSLYRSAQVDHFTNLIMTEGRKELADQMMQKMFLRVKEIQHKKARKTEQPVETDPTELLKRALENARPIIGITQVRVGSVVYDVPTPISYKRSEFEAMRWVIEAARDRNKKEIMFPERLAEIVVETAENTGRVINRRNEHHKLCEVNRAFAHYRKGK